MKVLIDTSIWIEYFRSGDAAEELDFLIDKNLVHTNDLILTELIPYLKLQRKIALIEILRLVSRLNMDIDWPQIQEFQYRCLKNGINKIGIPDLLIIQNAIQNNSLIFSLDKHFQLTRDILGFRLYE